MGVNETKWVCEHTTLFQTNPKGIFYNEDPLNYTLTVVLLQASIACLASLFFEFLLVPIGETTFIPHVLVIQHIYFVICIYIIIYSADNNA